MKTLVLLCLTAASTTCLRAGIGPSKLEVNLGILPIDVYTTPQTVDLFPGASCHTVSNTTPQTCVRQFLANYKSQGVTGVRFFFALGDGKWTVNNSNFYSSYSSPFTAGGGLNTTWSANLFAFLADVKAAGIQNVTPVSVMSYYWSGWGGPLASIKNVSYLSNAGCKTGTETLLFFPWLPFGLQVNTQNPVLQYPADQGYNDAYNCSPANPAFWGWTPYLNLVADIVATARQNNVTIEEYEVETEINLAQFTVAGRLLYDNTTNTPVLAQVNSKLQPYFGTVATYSTQTVDPPSAAYDCGSAYGDSAHLLYASELLAAMGSSYIGQPFNGTQNGPMYCGGTLPTTTIPTNSLVPRVIDNHISPCVSPGASCNPNIDLTSTAMNMYDDLYTFLSYRNLLANLNMIGETISSSPSGYGCDGFTVSNAAENANGYVASSLYSHQGPTTVVRPWEWITSVAPGLCLTPGPIGAPSGPYHE